MGALILDVISTKTFRYPHTSDTKGLIREPTLPIPAQNPIPKALVWVGKTWRVRTGGIFIARLSKNLLTSKAKTPVVPLIRKCSRFAKTWHWRLWRWGSGLWQMGCVSPKTVWHQSSEYEGSLKSKECRRTSREKNTNTWATKTEKTSGSQTPCSSFDQSGPVPKQAVSDLEEKKNQKLEFKRFSVWI